MVDIASRIRARLSKRRHSSSATPSLASSQSAFDETSSLTSQNQIQSHTLGSPCQNRDVSSLYEDKETPIADPRLALDSRGSIDTRNSTLRRTWECNQEPSHNQPTSNLVSQNQRDLPPVRDANDAPATLSPSRSVPAIANANHRQLSSAPQKSPSNLDSITETSTADNPSSSANSKGRLVGNLSKDTGGDADSENDELDKARKRPSPHYLDRLGASDFPPDCISRSASLSSRKPASTLETPASLLASNPAVPPRLQQTSKEYLDPDCPTRLNPSTNTLSGGAPARSSMATRKIWVKRPGASATLIPIQDDDLVDDVRDMILRKYANSLGRTFDAPDLTIRIHPREQQHKDRLLGPEEHIVRTLDAYYSGGQNVDEALVIDIPRRTPKASPRAPSHPYIADDGRPSEAGEGYFPPVGTMPSPYMPLAVPAPVNGGSGHHSISVLGTGHIPPIPSPGGGTRRSYKDRQERPRPGRTHTSSPTVMGSSAGTMPVTLPAQSHNTQLYITRPTRSRTHSDSSDQPGQPPVAPPLPTSPIPSEATVARTGTPPVRTQSPRPPNTRLKRNKKTTADQHPTLPQGMLNGGVPPINVLIVEDNPINLKLLEAFVKRLKVRWQTAMNGRDAVKKWRTGGFHLVLMDIQLPVMNGLEATREIRRLERVNSIGVFSSSPGGLLDDRDGDLDDKDKLDNPSLFKSPVIIVALTASSLQSDRHEALAAGCNDFLTKVCDTVALT